VVLLVLAVGAGLAFSEVKWALGMSGTVELWDQDGAVGWSAAQDTSYTFTGSDGDLSFTATGEPDGDSFLGTLRNIQGSYTLFNKMLKLTAGKDRISDYRSTTIIQGSNAYTRFANAEWGLAFQVYPIKDANIGAFVKFPGAGVVAQDYANMLGFGASYALADIGTFNLVFRTMDALPVENELGFSTKISAIEGLPLVLGYGLKLEPTADNLHTIYFSTSYAPMEPLLVALDVKLTYQTDLDYVAELQTTYAVNKTWTAGLDLYYGTIDYGDEVGGGFAACPWVKMQVGGNQWLKPGFIIDTDGDGAGADVLLWNIFLYYEINL
jgi:hypothetical protein